jgi:hypothetical protein
MLFFVGFTLIEYVRSGRIWLEIGAATAFYVVLLRGEIDTEKFFSLVGIFTLLLTLYTMSSVVSLGDRPQGYMVLARRIGRVGYLLGLYISAMVLVASIYMLLSAATATISQFTDLTLVGWLLGTLPLLLNVGLLAALLLLLSPLVFSTAWRLLVLGLIALAFSGNFLGHAALDSLGPTLRGLLQGLQTVLGWPLVPPFSGFALSLSRDYSGSAPAILVSQASLLVALLTLAMYAFSRREVLFHIE